MIGLICEVMGRRGRAAANGFDGLVKGLNHIAEEMDAGVLIQAV